MADLTKESYWNLVEELAADATQTGIDESQYEQDAIERATDRVGELIEMEQGQGGVLSTYDKQLQVLRWTGEGEAIFDRGHGIQGRSATDIVKEIAEMALYADVDHQVDGGEIEDAFSEEEEEEDY